MGHLRNGVWRRRAALVFAGRERRAAVDRLVGVSRFFLPRWLSFGELTDELAITGAALCIIGVAFAVWARVALGRNWGMPMTRHADPELVTSGPYRFVRHPIYTGLSVILIGSALVYPHAVALPCALMVGYSVFSARREERDLEARFPETYPVYKRRSKFLVPFVF